MTLKDLIRKERSKLGMTQYEFASHIGFERTSVQNWERGRTKFIHPKTALLLSEVFPEYGDSDWWYSTFRRPSDKARCSVFRCFKWHFAKTYCENHYREFKIYGKIREECEKRAKNGEGHLDRTGYVRVSNPRGGQTFQHRVVMEEHIGRALFKHENVHHLNGIRNDNRIENLELWTKSQPSGQRVEDKIKWARDFLEEYDTLEEKEYVTRSR